MTTTRHAGAGALALALLMGACGDPGLETRTYELRYLRPHEASAIIEPYVYEDRERAPGRMTVSEHAVSVRETSENLDRIARVLDTYDRPRPTVMLHFQIIGANGAAGADPAIADVERELRRLLRFDGYELLAETQVGGIQGTAIRQVARRQDESFHIHAGVTEVRNAGSTPTVTLDVSLAIPGMPPALETSVTVPAGHSVVLGTTQTPNREGALILVVRADIIEMGARPDSV